MAEFSAGRNESARSNYGGINCVFLINNRADNYAPVVNLATGVVTSIGEGTEGDRVTAYKFGLRGQNTFSQPGAGGGMETGTNVVLQSLILQLKTTVAADNVNIQNIATNRPKILIVDYKEGVWLAGRQFGLETKKYEQVFGTNPEDFVGYNLEFEGKEPFFAEYCGQATRDPVDGLYVLPTSLNVLTVEGSGTPG